MTIEHASRLRMVATYLNFQARIMINYIHAFLNRYNQPSGADVVATRAQVVW
jgi:hypothetical protein